MYRWLTQIFDTEGYPPRWHCGTAWEEQPGWGWLTVASDFFIWGAYMAIPLVLVHFVRQRRDIPFRPLFWLFGAFILACGTTHLIDMAIFWWPAYRLSAVVKLTTALVSWGTVVALLRNVPAAMALRSPQQMDREVQRRTAELENVTAQLRAEAAARTEVERTLRESEERLRMALRAGRMGTWDWDVRTNETRVNSTEFDLFDVQRESRALPIQSFFEQIHPEDEPRIREAVRCALERRREFDEEFRVVRQDGEVRWLAGRAEVVTDSKNHPVRMIGVHFDVTDRKRDGLRLEQEMTARLQAQRSLERSEDWLKMVLRAGGMGTWDWDLATDTAVLDESECELLGLPVGAGTHPAGLFFDRVHPDDRLELESAIQACLHGDQDYDREFRILRPDGSLRWIAGRGDVIRDDKGRPLRMAGVNFDVTQSKLAEEWLRSSERFLRRVLDGLFVFAGVLTRDGTLIQANQAFLETGGLEPEAVLGRAFAETAWWSHDPAAQERIRDAVSRASEGETLRFDAAIRAHDDGLVPIDFQIVPMRDDDGRVTHLIPSGIDISERKQFERSLEVARIQANAANRAKSEFLANMSHEIRTPLTAILGCADTLYPQVPDGTQREAVQLIRNQGRLLLGLLNDILDLSKIEAGRLEIHREPSSIRAVVEEVRSVLGAQAVEKGIALETRYDTLVPAVIETDSLRLRQILLNLVGNAVKFTDQGSVWLSVRCETESDPARLLVSVRDTGVGIPPDRLQSIFEAFAQEHRELTRRHGGTGLGLTICQRLARMLRGEIRVESRVGEGSEFTLDLPIGPPEGLCLQNAESLPAASEPARGPQVVDRLPCRVLVAEDTDGIQFMLRHMLKGAVDSVTVVANGEEAVREYERGLADGVPYHVILMDMQMPVLNGFDATVRLRDAGCRLPIIALTAAAMSGDRDRCLAAGCDDYLSKPIDQQRLLSLVAHHYNQNREIR